MDWSRVVITHTRSLPDRVSFRLERLILEGDLKVGDRLPSKRELSEMLGVSRVSARQALHEIESRGGG